MQLTTQQDQAISRILTWARDPRSPQILRLSGAAGTGKTTIMKQVSDQLTDRIYWVAPTGRAANRLSLSTGKGATTIHNLIYKAEMIWGEPQFQFIGDTLDPSFLIVCDEASMVNGTMGDDLRATGCKILYVGDGFQLPPIGEGSPFLDSPPDILLTEVHRQALDSPILAYATQLRGGPRSTVPWTGSLRQKVGKWKDWEADMRWADIIITGKNQSRERLNDLYRSLRFPQEFSHEPILPGETLINLRNNRAYYPMITNGELLTVTSSHLSGHRGPWDLVFTRPDYPSLPAISAPAQLHMDGKVPNTFSGTSRQTLHTTYGYCVTVHKFQGSQAPRVILYDDGFAYGRATDRNRWLYTAVTRASSDLLIIRENN
jgi:exodeoxyribonuclease-5